MIKITNTEKIKKNGDFELDRFWVKKIMIENPTIGTAKKSLTVELVPFNYLEDGTPVFDYENIKKIYVPDANAWIVAENDMEFAQAYAGIQVSIAKLMGIQHPGWDCVYEAP